MPNRLLVLIRRAAPPDPHSDADLIRRYVSLRDDEAFTALVRRHGGLVWAVCRDHLPNEADAEDAFQAVWVALARHAGRVRNPQAVAGWLHGTAVRVCHHSRRAAGRRAKHELASGKAERRSEADATQWHELAAAVHAEVDRLPDRERAVFVLVALEGVRQADAAERLGIKLNSLSGLLARGRQRVLAGLTKKGLAPAAALAAVTTGCQPPLAVAAAVGGEVSKTVLELARGAVGISVRTKLMAAVLTVGVGTGAAWLATAGAQQFPDGPKTPASGGPPGAGAAGMPGMMPGGPGMPSAGPRWEHKLVEMNAGLTAQELKRLLDAQAVGGWEFGGQLMNGISNPDAGRTPTTYAVFRRQIPVPPATLGGMPGMGMSMGGPGGMSPGATGTADGGRALPDLPRANLFDRPGVGEGGGRAASPGGEGAGSARTEVPPNFPGRVTLGVKGPRKAGAKFFDTWVLPRDLSAKQHFVTINLERLRAADLVGLKVGEAEVVAELTRTNEVGCIGELGDLQKLCEKIAKFDGQKK